MTALWIGLFIFIGFCLGVIAMRPRKPKGQDNKDVAI